MKLTAVDRSIMHLISQAFPPAVKENSPLPVEMDWAPIIARAEKYAMAPLLFDSVKQTGRLREIPASLLLDFRSTYLRSANHNEENFRELAALLDALGEAHIPVILLKGAALAVALYDRTAQRPMCDMDLLISKDALPAFIKIIGNRGFVEYHNLGKGFEQEFKSELCYVRPDASRLAIEPHWHVFNSPSTAEKIPVEWFWRHTAPVDVRGRRAMMLSPTAALLHLAVHYYVHHSGAGLLSLYDVARLLTRWSDRIDWDELSETAKSCGYLWAVQAILREVTAVWQVPLPASFVLEMDAAGGIPQTEIASPSRYLHHIEELMSVAGWKARLTYLWILLFPSKGYLRDRYGMREDRLALFYYGYRMIRCIVRLPSLLVAFLRRRSTVHKGRVINPSDF
jgi:hypothetical protein